MSTFASLVYLSLVDPRSPLPALSVAEEIVLSEGRCILVSELERAMHSFLVSKANRETKK